MTPEKRTDLLVGACSHVGVAPRAAVTGGHDYACASCIAKAIATEQKRGDEHLAAYMHMKSLSDGRALRIEALEKIERKHKQSCPYVESERDQYRDDYRALQTELGVDWDNVEEDHAAALEKIRTLKNRPPMACSTCEDWNLEICDKNDALTRENEDLREVCTEKGVLAFVVANQEHQRNMDAVVSALMWSGGSPLENLSNIKDSDAGAKVESIIKERDALKAENERLSDCAVDMTIDYGQLQIELDRVKRELAYAIDANFAFNVKVAGEINEARRQRDALSVRFRALLACPKNECNIRDVCSYPTACVSRSSLLEAEVGTLRAKVAELEASKEIWMKLGADAAVPALRDENEALKARVKELEDRKTDEQYRLWIQPGGDCK